MRFDRKTVKEKLAELDDEERALILEELRGKKSDDPDLLARIEALTQEVEALKSSRKPTAPAPGKSKAAGFLDGLLPDWSK